MGIKTSPPRGVFVGCICISLSLYIYIYIERERESDRAWTPRLSGRPVRDLARGPVSAPGVHLAASD